MKVEKGRNYYDCGKSEQSSIDGEKLLCRNPGMIAAKLEDLWQVHYVIDKKLNAVNYLIRKEDCRKERKAVHVNMVKMF